MTQIANKRVVRKNNYFSLCKTVYRPQKGNGSRFQNHKVSVYTIEGNHDVWSSAWQPHEDEVSRLIGPPYKTISTDSHSVWKYDSRSAAGKAWVLLGLKYS